MAYRPEVLRESIDRRERDAAPYFAGRASQTERFERALRSLSKRRHNDRGAEFLIYQGAPGCGKTSLAKHLDDTHADALFVQLAMDHLHSSAALEEKIEAEALASARLGRRGALLVLRAAGGLGIDETDCPGSGAVMEDRSAVRRRRSINPPPNPLASPP